MKAISLWQPWASMIALGAKTIETRSWYTPYRGPIAIHAAKRWTTDEQATCRQKPFRTVLEASTLKTMPLGMVVALATLDECILMRADNMPDPKSDEHAFGLYQPGRYMWYLSDVVSLLEAPVPTRGYQQLWDWEFPDDYVDLPYLHEYSTRHAPQLRLDVV